MWRTHTTAPYKLTHCGTRAQSLLEGNEEKVREDKQQSNEVRSGGPLPRLICLDASVSTCKYPAQVQASGATHMWSGESANHESRCSQRVVRRTNALDSRPRPVTSRSDIHRGSSLPCRLHKPFLFDFAKHEQFAFSSTTHRLYPDGASRKPVWVCRVQLRTNTRVLSRLLSVEESNAESDAARSSAREQVKFQ